jgi:DNA-binding transcriptional MerR regulator
MAMRIGELARRTGVSTRALRYYEEQGLLRSDRTSGGQREYAEGAELYVRFFQQMYAAGLSSSRIAELLPCFSTGGLDEQQQRMLVVERDRLNERIAELQAARDRLDEVITLSESHVTAA